MEDVGELPLAVVRIEDFGRDTNLDEVVFDVRHLARERGIIHF